MEYSKDIKNPESKKNLVEGLKLLHDTVNKKYEATKDTVDKLTKFSGELTSDNRNFEKDYNLAR